MGSWSYDIAKRFHFGWNFHVCIIMCVKFILEFHHNFGLKLIIEIYLWWKIFCCTSIYILIASTLSVPMLSILHMIPWSLRTAVTLNTVKLWKHFWRFNVKTWNILQMVSILCNFADSFLRNCITKSNFQKKTFFNVQNRLWHSNKPISYYNTRP